MKTTGNHELKKISGNFLYKFSLLFFFDTEINIFLRKTELFYYAYDHKLTENEDTYWICSGNRL